LANWYQFRLGNWILASESIFIDWIMARNKCLPFNLPYEVRVDSLYFNITITCLPVRSTATLRSNQAVTFEQQD